ncbi:MAG: YCF48-related protein [bacterium]
MSRPSWYSLILASCMMAITFAGFTQQWTLKNPLPTNADLKGVCLINHDTGFACGTFQTILKTTDGGQTWQYKGVRANNQLNGITFSSRDTGFAVGWTGSILKTTDCGETWQQLPQPFLSDATDLLDVFFHDKLHGWISGTYSGLIRTVDGGASWHVLSHNVSQNISFDIVRFVNPDTGFVAGNQNFNQTGILKKTTDGGINWTNVSFPAEINGIGGLEALSANELWIGARNRIYSVNGMATRIYHTLDGGVTWTSTDLMYNTGSEINGIKFTDPLHGRVLCSERMFTTGNGGIDWQEHLVSYDWSFLLSMAWADSSKCITVGSYGYIFNSENGGQEWNELSHGTRANFTDIFFTNALTGFAVGYQSTPAAIYKTIDGGDTWAKIPIDSAVPGHLNNVYFSDESNGWTSGYWGLLLHSVNAGQTWNPVDPGVQNTWYALALHTGKYIWVGGYQSKLVRSADYGNSWQDVSLPSTDYDVRKIAFPDSLIGYITLAKPYDNVHSLMFRTTDGGATWIPVDFINSTTKGVLSMSFTDALHGFISIYNEGMAKTGDGGITWQSMGPVGNNSAPSYIKFTDAQNGVACSGDNFVAVTHDGCATWDIKVNTQLQAGFIGNYFFANSDHGWLAAWHGLIKEYSSTGVGIHQQNNTNADGPVIFPNPAGDILAFSSTEDILQAKIYDMQGNCMKAIRGSYLKSIQTNGLTPGGYVLGLSSAQGEYFMRFIKR